ncbi:MAG: class I SAM-dependent methyltransferase [Bacteroidetes bacterium]|nr:class I SAM-dependent methyltransferase [Bacteroidota bacterium]
MINLPSCPVCSSTGFHPFITCTDYTTSGEKFDLKKCATCGFTFTDPRPDKSTIGKYYLSESYISHTGGRQTLFDKMYLLVRSFALKRKRRIVESFSQGKTLLDFGCGTGNFLHKMKKSGWEIIGVEPSPQANKKASELTEIEIYEELSIVKRSVDVVTLWHVLEHLHDLNEILRQLNDRLKESGVIILAVPNLESFDAKHYQEHWAGYDVPRHLWHFNKQAMERLLLNNGFKLKKMLPLPFDSYYVSMLSESYRNKKRSAVLKLLSALRIGLASNLRAKKTMNYSSLIYIASK